MLMEKAGRRSAGAGDRYRHPVQGHAAYPQKVPQVVLDWGNECDFANVINDNARIGARLAVRHLLEQGHTNIVRITGHLAKPTTQQRLDGVRDALLNRG